MRVEINAGDICGQVSAPPSKSMAHRALICAYLSGQKCQINNIAYSADIKATVGALRALGAHITEKEASVIVGGAADGSVRKQNAGVNDALGQSAAENGSYAENSDRTSVEAPADKLFCGESGSTLRFMIPLCLMTGRKITLYGTKRLFSRSLSVFEKLCAERGFDYIQSEDSLTLCGRLSPGTFRVRGDISSQFISGLMFVLPLLQQDSKIEIEGKIESMPYLKLTESALAEFGVRLCINDGIIEIPGGQRYRGRDCTVEGDWSNAAFFYALNTIGHSVTVTGLNEKSLQGDSVCIEYLRQISKGSPVLDVSNCPDLAPVLIAAAAANSGGTLIGTKRLKIKESDRAGAMAAELKKFGVNVTVNENSIVAEHGITKPCEPLSGHNDHRIVMALALLCTKTGGIIEGAQAVGKSMPDFFDKLESLGAKIKRTETNEA